MEVPFAFETLPDARVRPAWALGAERGAVTGAFAIALGPLPSCASYLWEHWNELTPDTWGRLIVQVATFVLVTGVSWGLCVGLALGLVRHRVVGQRRSAVMLLYWVASAIAGVIV